jgi:hypothetical protein
VVPVTDVFMAITAIALLGFVFLVFLWATTEAGKNGHTAMPYHYHGVDLKPDVEETLTPEEYESKLAPETDPIPLTCQGVCKDDTQCNRAVAIGEYCWMHEDQADE